MKNKQIEQEVRFIRHLKSLTKQRLFEAYVRSIGITEDYDIVKALGILNRMFDAEIEYIEQNPEDYLDIYN